MVIRLGSNTESLRIQGSLTRASDKLASSYRALSSGLRINSPSDDAAGLAVASSLNVEARVFNQGIRNLNDGISLLNIAQSAGQSLTDIIVRVRELAEQSANGVNGTTQRVALDNEAQALRQEFERISSIAEFNGVTLLDGSNSVILMQGGGTSRTTQINLPTIDGSLLSSSISTTTNTGSFLAGAAYTVGPNAGVQVTTSDVDRDGDMDLLQAVQTEHAVYISLNNGDGTFKASLSYQAGAGTSPFGLVLGDVNGDTQLDVMMSGTGQAYSVLLGNGNGTFKAGVSYSTGSYSTEGIVAVDMNSDSILDLVMDGYAAGGPGVVQVLYGNGNGTFAAALTYFAHANANSSNSLVVRDVNSDNILDVVNVTNSGGQLNIFLGNSNGTLKARISHSTIVGFEGVEVGDLDGDLDMDVVAFSGSGTAGSVRVFIGNNDGTFKADVSYNGAGAEFGPRTGDIKDLNGDGYLDIVAGDTAVNVYFGNGNGTFKAALTVGSVTSRRSHHISDVNGDGAWDLISSTGNGVSVFLGNGDTVTSSVVFNLLTQQNALETMDTLENAQNVLAQRLGEFGGYQNRLGVQLRVLGTLQETYKAAYSRIIDVDVAEESARLLSATIVRDVASAVLSQANRLPEIALSLLRN